MCNVWRTLEFHKFTVHKVCDIGVCIHPVVVHVLQFRKVVQHIEEYIVQKGVVLVVNVKRVSWFHRVAIATLVVKQATCPSNAESSRMTNNYNIAYDIAYDIVCQHTMSYISI